jgi:hypothetical protein
MAALGDRAVVPPLATDQSLDGSSPLFRQAILAARLDDPPEHLPAA